MKNFKELVEENYPEMSSVFTDTEYGIFDDALEIYYGISTTPISKDDIIAIVDYVYNDQWSSNIYSIDIALMLLAEDAFVPELWYVDTIYDIMYANSDVLINTSDYYDMLSTIYYDPTYIMLSIINMYSTDFPELEYIGDELISLSTVSGIPTYEELIIFSQLSNDVDLTTIDLFGIRESLYAGVYYLYDDYDVLTIRESLSDVSIAKINSDLMLDIYNSINDESLTTMDDLMSSIDDEIDKAVDENYDRILEEAYEENTSDTVSISEVIESQHASTGPTQITETGNILMGVSFIILFTLIGISSIIKAKKK